MSRNIAITEQKVNNGTVWGSPNGTIGNFTSGTIGRQWYHWLTNGTNGTIGRADGTICITIGTNGNTNGTIGRTLNDIGIPLVPLVEPSIHAISKSKSSYISLETVSL